MPAHFVILGKKVLILQKTAYQLSLKFLFISFGLLLIGSLPSLFVGLTPNLSAYFQSIIEVLKHLVHPLKLTYNLQGTDRPLFPAILISWKTSMTLLIPSFVIALIISLFLVFLTMLLPSKVRRGINFLLFFIESVPDVLVIGVFQLAVIWIYQQTHILFFNIVSFGDVNAYTLPMIVLTLLPLALFYRMMVLDAEAESQKQYVEFAQCKGLRKHKIILRHIFRNALISLFAHSKLNLWFMLSNLLIVEFIFNINGLLVFLFYNMSPILFTIGLFMLFIPIFIIFSIGQFFIVYVTKQKVDF
jgi:ABC-type dipeptide/oligopeptide/nickel transport system permease component